MCQQNFYASHIFVILMKFNEIFLNIKSFGKRRKEGRNISTSKLLELFKYLLFILLTDDEEIAYNLRPSR